MLTIMQTTSMLIELFGLVIVDKEDVMFMYILMLYTTVMFVILPH